MKNVSLDILSPSQRRKVNLWNKLKKLLGIFKNSNNHPLNKVIPR